MIGFLDYKQIPFINHKSNNNCSSEQKQTSSALKVQKRQSINDLILSSNSNTAPFYYLDKFRKGEMGPVKAVSSYALSNVPFYSYYTIYDKVRHKEVNRNDAIKAVFINTLANLS